MMNRRKFCAICGFLLLIGFSFLNKTEATNIRSADVLYLSHAKFLKLAAAALAWVEKHPNSPESPHLLFQVIMSATVRGDDQSDLKAARRQLLLDFPDSTESHYFLARIPSPRSTTVASPSAKAYRATVSDLLAWYTRHPTRKNAKAIDGVIRSGLQRFAIRAARANDSQYAMLCYLVAHAAGDTTVANEMIGATEPTKDAENSAEALATAEIREVVIDNDMPTLQKLKDLDILGQSGSTSLLVRYYLHRLPPGEQSSSQIIAIRASDLTECHHFHRALVVIAAAAKRGIQTDRLAFLQVYCKAVLGKVRGAQAAAQAMQAAYPKSRWTVVALELARLAATQDVAEIQLVNAALRYAHWAGKHINGCELRATFKPASNSFWTAYAGIAGHHGEMQISRNGSMIAGVAWNRHIIRLLDPKANCTVIMPMSQKVGSSAHHTAPDTKIADILESLGSADLSARGLLSRYTPTWMKTYAGAMRIFAIMHKNGCFIAPLPSRHGSEACELVVANLFHPELLRISVTFDRRTHHLKVTCSPYLTLSVEASSSAQFVLASPQWPVTKSVRKPKTLSGSLNAIAGQLPGWTKALGELTKSFQSIRSGDDKTITSLEQAALATSGTRLPPEFDGGENIVPPQVAAQVSQKAGKTLAWARLHPNAVDAPARLFNALMLAKLARKPTLAGRLERRLILYYGSSVQGRYDLARFATPAEFGDLVQALFKHNAYRMTPSRQKAILRVVYYGLQEFANSKNEKDIFGTGHRVALVFCDMLALQAGWADLAKNLHSAIVALATSDKTFASVWDCVSQPGQTPAERIDKLAHVEGSRMNLFLAIYLIRMSHHRHANAKIMRSAELVYSETGHFRRACAYADDLAKQNLNSARIEFIHATCELRLGKPASARQTALEAMKLFPSSPWKSDLQLLAANSQSNQGNFQKCVKALLTADRWAIREPEGFEVSVHYVHAGKPACTACLAGASGFFQLYVGLGTDPIMAIRIRNKMLDMLAPTRSLIERYNSGNIYVGGSCSAVFHIEGTQTFSIRYGFSSGVVGAYTFPPLTQQLKQYYVYSDAGIRRMLSSATRGDIFLAPVTGQNGNIFTIVALSSPHPSQQQMTFEIRTTGRPEWLKTNGGLTFHFQFLTKQHPRFDKLPWPKCRVVMRHATGWALIGRAISNLTGGAAMATKAIAEGVTPIVGDQAARCVQ